MTTLYATEKVCSLAKVIHNCSYFGINKYFILYVYNIICRNLSHNMNCVLLLPYCQYFSIFIRNYVTVVRVE